MAEHEKILVYHYRHNGTPAIKDGLAVISWVELRNLLAAHPGLQSTTKPIPRAAFSVDIYQCDIATAEIAAQEHPNQDANVARVTLPVKVVLSKLVAGQYAELVILSKKL